MSEEHKMTGPPVSTSDAKALILIFTEVAQADDHTVREAIQWALRRRTVYDPGRLALEHAAAALDIPLPLVKGQPHHQAPSRLAERIVGIAETGSPEKHR